MLKCVLQDLYRPTKAALVQITLSECLCKHERWAVLPELYDRREWKIFGRTFHTHFFLLMLSFTLSMDRLDSGTPVVFIYEFSLSLSCPLDLCACQELFGNSPSVGGLPQRTTDVRTCSAGCAHFLPCGQQKWSLHTVFTAGATTISGISQQSRFPVMQSWQMSADRDCL